VNLGNIMDMVKNDLKPSVQATLTYDDGSAVNLTGCTVKFHMSKAGTLLVNKAATIVNASAGQVRYDWASADTAVTVDADGYALCEAEFEVTFADLTIMTFPSKKGEFQIRFREELA
jgi:hypothetical protein